MEVLINGQPVKEYFLNHKIFIEGRKGSVFSLRLRNNSSERILFVPTVDGLSVMDGKEGSFDSRGYIVSAYNSVTIDGWRLSNQEVAEFYFSSPEDSYRKRKGMGDNIGSIAVAVFREKEKIIPKWPNYIEVLPDYPKQRPWNGDPFWPEYPEYSKRMFGQQTLFDSNLKDRNIELSTIPTSACCFSCQKSVSQEIGTGFGETKRSEVITVSFDKEKEPDAIFEVFYNSRKQLEKLGIDLDRQLMSISEPNSFPNEKSYCERPNR